MRLNLKYSFSRSKKSKLFILKGKWGFFFTINFLNLSFFAEHYSKASDIKETTAKNKNRSKLGSLLLQVKY